MTLDDPLTDLATDIGNLDSTAILTAFWYVVLVAVAAYSLYRAATLMGNSFSSIGARLRRVSAYLLERRR